MRMRRLVALSIPQNDCGSSRTDLHNVFEHLCCLQRGASLQRQMQWVPNVNKKENRLIHSDLTRTLDKKSLNAVLPQASMCTDMDSHNHKTSGMTMNGRTTTIHPYTADALRCSRTTRPWVSGSTCRR